MAAAPIIIVCLRRPDRRDPNETRADPFWEFGSFGCTGCHSKNLMNPKRLDELEGCRLAFAQGGPQGFRLVHLTPPVTPHSHGERNELCWTPAEMPFRHGSAPVLIANDETSDFPLLKRALQNGYCSTWEGQFRSNFRSRRQPLPGAIATQIARVYAARRRSAPPSAICSSYDQALPWPPPKIDRARKSTYDRLIDAKPRRSACGRPTPASPRSCGSARRKRC
jgi:hypothetical protein